MTRIDYAAIAAEEKKKSLNFIGSAKALLLKHMLFREIGMIEVEFDGSGDSGSIQDIILCHFIPKGDPCGWTARPVKPEAVKTFFKDNVGALNCNTVEELIEQTSYKILTETGMDWYNNDGGWGSIIFEIIRANGTDPDKLEVSVSMNIRYTESNNYQFDY